MATDHLFTAAELGNWLGLPNPVPEARFEVVERVVWGWLSPRLGASDRPEPVAPELFSWAVELGAIAHENPAGLSSKQLGPEMKAFSAERRDELLAQVGTDNTATGLTPRGSFPDSRAYPDPAVQ